MADFERDKIMSRIRKMLRLAADAAASEGERDNALRMAHATLAKYNLSLSEAEESADTDSTSSEPRIKASTESNGQAWIRTIYHGVARAYFCRYFFIRNATNKVSHYFVGRESNTITAREIGTFLYKSVLREASRTAREQLQNGAFHRSFCNGAAARIYWRCDELMKAQVTPDAADVPKAPGTALVLASVYAMETQRNEAWLAAHGINLSSDRGGARSAHSDGYRAGAAYGNSVHIGRQLGTGTRAPRIK